MTVISDAQRDVLEALDSGAVLVSENEGFERVEGDDYKHGLGWRVGIFLIRNPDAAERQCESVHWRALEALADRGWIDRPPRARHWRLTNMGRRALMLDRRARAS